MYLLEKEFLEGTTIHLWWRFDAGNIQERRRQIDVQNYVIYSATLCGCFITTLISGLGLSDVYLFLNDFSRTKANSCGDQSFANIDIIITRIIV